MVGSIVSGVALGECALKFNVHVEGVLAGDEVRVQPAVALVGGIVHLPLGAEEALRRVDPEQGVDVDLLLRERGGLAPAHHPALAGALVDHQGEPECAAQLHVRADLHPELLAHAALQVGVAQALDGFNERVGAPETPRVQAQQLGASRASSTSSIHPSRR